MLDQPLTHEEVLETGARVKEAFANWFVELSGRWSCSA